MMSAPLPGAQSPPVVSLSALALASASRRVQTPSVLTVSALLSTVIPLAARVVNQTARLKVIAIDIRVSQKIAVSPNQARRPANGFLAGHLAMMVGGGQPCQTFW